MVLAKLVLQHFRSYTQRTFQFDPKTTIIVGVNTAGKTNIIEAINLLSSGKSFRAEKDIQMIQVDKEIARVQGLILEEAPEGQAKKVHENIKLEVVLVSPSVNGRFSKKYSVNDVQKRRIDFAGNLPLVLFSPEEMDIIIGSPSLRRHFLNTVLEQTDREYRYCVSTYEKALQQRNALLEQAKDTGIKNQKQFSYWDELLITNGQLIISKREAFIAFLNQEHKDIFPMEVVYDPSIISQERLEQYKHAEVASGMTLVGPQRDDFFVQATTGKGQQNMKHFGSRGQQRLVVLQLKLLQIIYMEKMLGERPLLLLDDILSELDSNHIKLVLSMIQHQQTILTTTHKELIAKTRDTSIIEI